MQEVFETDGILVGWYSTAINQDGRRVKVFIPRRDEDIAEDRAAKETEKAGTLWAVIIEDCDHCFKRFVVKIIADSREEALAKAHKHYDRQGVPALISKVTNLRPCL